MSEIEKMYENAGVNQVCNTCELRGFKRLCPSKELCVRTNPPFTAEKQIAILQFCLKWGQVHILKGIDDEYRIENSYYRQGHQPTLADAIANYINEKWEKLTPEEKKQVKGILE
jgi:hypothetical protein